jgi:hypothetical protein
MSSEVYNIFVEWYQQHIVLIWTINIICLFIAYVMIGFMAQGFYTKKWGEFWVWGDSNNPGPGPLIGIGWPITIFCSLTAWISNKCFACGEWLAQPKPKRK